MSFDYGVGRFRAINVSLERLVLLAYGDTVRAAFQIVGAPRRIASSYFDVDARTSEDASSAEKMLMLRALLADRFRLVARVETRVQDVHAMVRVGDDGALGPNLARWAVVCSTDQSAVESDARSGAEPPACSSSMDVRTRPDGTFLAYTVRGMPLNDLALHLTGRLENPVVDTTGLKGRFDLTLEFRPDPPLFLGLFRRASGFADVPVLRAALREQLGLELVDRRGLAPVLVIDAVQELQAN